MRSATNNGVRPTDELWVKSLVARSVLRAADAMTAPGVSPSARLGVLMECHGTLLAARGPGSELSFADFRRQVRGDPSRLCWHTPHQATGATYRFRPVEGIVSPDRLRCRAAPTT